MDTTKDVTTKAECAAGFKVLRIVSSHAYARNGNAHNPTPNYRWEVFSQDRLIGTVSRRKAASELIQTHQEIVRGK